MVDRDDFKLIKADAQKMFDKFRLGKVKTITKHFSGINNYIFFVNQYVVRISRRDSYTLGKERLIYGLNLPTPKILAYDNSLSIIPKPYQVMTKIIGKPIDFDKNITEFARMVAKIHSIHFKDCGYFDISRGLRAEKEQSWEGFFRKNFNHNITVLKHHLKTGHVQEITGFYNRYKSLLKVKFQPCLIHHDLSKDNIYVHKNKISGVLDFEWAFSGHNEYELSKIEYQILNEKNRHAFFQTYGKYHSISREYPKRKVFYRFLNLVMMIAGIYEDKEPQNDKKYVSELNIILNKPL